MKKLENSVSNIIAIVLSIINSVLFIPGIFGIVIYTMVLFGGKSWLYIYNRFFEILNKSEGISYLFTRSIPYVLFLIGSLLLAGYILRTFGKLNAKLQSVLWIATFIYNLPLPLFAIYMMLTTVITSQNRGSLTDLSRLLYPMLIVIWMTLTCVLSGVAFWKDLFQNKQNTIAELR